MVTSGNRVRTDDDDDDDCLAAVQAGRSVCAQIHTHIQSGKAGERKIRKDTLHRTV